MICKTCKQDIPLTLMAQLHGQCKNECKKCRADKAKKRQEILTEQKRNTIITSLEKNYLIIKNFENYYINPNGEIISVNKYRMGKIHPSIRPDGYVIVILYNNKKKSTHYLHRLVADAFLPKVAEKTYINHKDGNKQNNNVENLEWCTYSENNKHMYAVLGHKGSLYGVHGANHPSAKPVKQYTLQGEFLKKFNSMNDARKYLNIKESDHSIHKNCIGEKEEAHGYKWEYCSEDKTPVVYTTHPSPVQTTGDPCINQPQY